MEKMNKTELNERQKAVYAHLQMLNGETIKLKDLCEELSYQFSEFVTKSKVNFNNTNARRVLTADIRKISNSDMVDKFVVSNGNGVALATETTYIEELSREKKKILKMLSLYWKKVEKLKRNHQFVINFDNQEAREEIESLLVETRGE
jgi:hypothetical protein